MLKGSWSVFEDPEVSEEEGRRILSTMKERILHETFHSELQATPYETNDKNLQVFMYLLYVMHDFIYLYTHYETTM